MRKFIFTILAATSMCAANAFTIYVAEENGHISTYETADLSAIEMLTSGDVTLVMTNDTRVAIPADDFKSIYLNEANSVSELLTDTGALQSDATLYTLDGNVVTTVKAGSQWTPANLAPGLYILKSDKKSTKFLVK